MLDHFLVRIEGSKLWIGFRYDDSANATIPQTYQNQVVFGLPKRGERRLGSLLSETTARRNAKPHI
jgi:hypothetical protein